MPLRNSPESEIDQSRITILYEDRYILAVEKPPGIHVHPTKLSRRETSLLDILQTPPPTAPPAPPPPSLLRLPDSNRHPNQAPGDSPPPSPRLPDSNRPNQAPGDSPPPSPRLYPAHRLDRPTGGVLLLAKDAETASILGERMRNREGITKHYLAAVRGWMDDSGTIERPLRQAPGKPERRALTHWRTLARCEAPWPDGRFPSSRFSLLECIPETGRYHQIRRHLRGAAHPVMGDIAHGDNTRNRIWTARTGLEGLMLRAHRLTFIHPVTNTPLRLTAPPDPNFLKAAHLLSWPPRLVTE